MLFKNPKCPVCRQPIKDLVFDFDDARIICTKCQSTLNPELVINNSTVNFLANLIPSDIREDFLSKLGFEKRPIVRTPKLGLGFLIVVLIAGTIVGVIIHSGNTARMLLTILVGGLAISAIIKYYKEEEIPKWTKKRTA